MKFAIFTDQHGSDVRVNPDRVAYASDLYKANGVTTLHFGKEFSLQVKGDLQATLRELANPRGS